MHPNEQRVRDLYAALGRDDVAGLYDMFAPDASMTVPGGSPLAGTYEGRDAIFDVLARAQAESGGTFSLELLDALANDSYAVTLHRWTAERGGRRIEANNMNVWRFDAQGRIASRSELLEDEAAHDEFWASG